VIVVVAIVCVRVCVCAYVCVSRGCWLRRELSICFQVVDGRRREFRISVEGEFAFGDALDYLS
jgi:hypothetical protein